MKRLSDFKYKAIVTSVALGLAAGHVSAQDADQQDERSHTWQESKMSAEEYWDNFKQDTNQTWESSQDAFRDGWVEGKLHTAITVNRHLNPFDVGVEVDNGRAILEGEVSSEIDAELAEEIAMGIEGIDEVENRLTVNQEAGDQRRQSADTDEPAPAGARTAGNATDRQDSDERDRERDEERGFAGYFNDATTTAAIKTELLSSSNVPGLSIDVDTENERVVLSGEVESEAEKDLAETIARNHVADVTNNITVDPGS